MKKAYVFLSCAPGSEDYVITQLKTINSIKDAYGTFGPYDIITKIEDNDSKNLGESIAELRHNVKKLLGTLTLIVKDDKNQFNKTLQKNEKEVLEKYSTFAYVTINYEKANVDENAIMGELEGIPEILESDAVIGPFDIMCRIVAPTYNDITEIITKKIRKIDNIKNTTTLNVINGQGFRR